ncbi:sensor histidine kinase [Emcibacter nanhaiensis]|uniref:histidine kinase n=1 Tax=Emcibacter nanhaiensis TaxID=1505037 RepID=A0A501PBF8_9PROT|nr:ATP-binding protein [Emcibacter nanhaiensis]TPD57316.1 PAS domain-containing protein [Emcibacter nanhaiensis]
MDQKSSYNSPLNELRPLIYSLPVAILLVVLTWFETVSVANAIIITALIFVSMLYLNRRYEEEIAELRRKTILQEHESRDTRASQFLLTNIMENLTDPFLLLDSRKRILMANKSAIDMLGADILRKDISLFIRNPDVNNAIRKTIRTGKTHTVEYMHGNVVPRNMLVRLHALDIQGSEDNQENKRYIFLSIYDITLIKQAEQMRVDFVANASHELRTPLASILGFVETLQGPAKNDLQAQERFLRIMHDEASRMTRLVDDLLSLSKIEREAHIPPEGTVHLPTLINSVLETLDMRLKERNMTVTVSNPDNVGNITGDFDQLTQVAQNLVDNAIKYGRENTAIDVVLKKHVSEFPIHEESVSIAITNRGNGIPAEHIPRLMERFYRVDTARSRSLGGTGLGLAIVKHIIQRHKGHILFESEVNEYTRVTVTLPYKSG